MKRDIIRLLKEGKSKTEIARLFKISEQRLEILCDKYGIGKGY